MLLNKLKHFASSIKHLPSTIKRKAGDRLLALTIPKISLPPQIANKRIIFIGASVGHDWRLELVFPRIETWTLFQFDKTPLVEKAILQKPDCIIIKECAAYFPAGGANKELITAWVKKIRHAELKVILATVVPVTRAHALRVPGRLEGLLDFNDWLCSYAAEEKIPLLDLEGALRISSHERFLQERLDTGDGLHLAFRTYRERLDPLLLKTLLSVFVDGASE